MENVRIDYSKESVLLVDDNAMTLAIIEEVLRSLGFSAITASSGTEALQSGQLEPYSFLLLDMNMPDVKGFEAMETVAKNAPATSVIAMTAHQVDDYRYIDLIRSGAADFIKKPVDLEELEAKLVRIIHERDLKKELNELSITDPLTNVYNRRHLFNRLKEETLRASRQKRPLSLMLLDLDRFKEYNDTRGHISGDEVLRNAAHLISKSIREGVDSVYRYGGDEFAVILIDAEPPVAREIGKRIQQNFKEYSEVSSSIGWTMYNENMTVTDFISEADRLLYRAKTAGKKSMGDLEPSPA
jgi:diguanylate cyclase (GGDEF)-like protein